MLTAREPDGRQNKDNLKSNGYYIRKKPQIQNDCGFIQFDPHFTMIYFFWYGVMISFNIGKCFLFNVTNLAWQISAVAAIRASARPVL